MGTTSQNGHSPQDWRSAFLLDLGQGQGVPEKGQEQMGGGHTEDLGGGYLTTGMEEQQSFNPWYSHTRMYELSVSLAWGGCWTRCGRPGQRRQSPRGLYWTSPCPPHILLAHPLLQLLLQQLAWHSVTDSPSPCAISCHVPWGFSSTPVWDAYSNQPHAYRHMAVTPCG